MKSLPDNKVPKKYQKALTSWRSLATELRYTGNIFWEIPKLSTFKKVAKDENAFNHFKYALSLDFEDTPTEKSFIFFIPRILPGSKNKTYAEQKELLEERGMVMGSVGLLSGLILAHFRETGERVPLDFEWVRTNTCRADGGRLRLDDFDSDGLDCGRWRFDEGPDSYLGVFALGVESLATRTLGTPITSDICVFCEQFHKQEHSLFL